MKKIIFTFILTTVLFFSANIYASNENLLYSESESQTITDGVTYEKISRLYKSGWKDIYILNIDVTNENISFEVIDSETEYGLKKSVEALAKENGVIAAVNGDFFGSGNPVSSMGQVFRNGNLDEGQNYYNSSENRYAGVFLDKYGNAFIDYVRTSIGLYNSENGSLELQGKNKVYSSFTKPVYFDTTAIKTTADLDKRHSSLYKIVVEKNVITKISAESETVTVPDNGHIIVMDKKTASEKLGSFYVGQSVNFVENNSFLFRTSKSISEILTGISGGGEVLRNGKIISQGLISGPKTRSPRTLIGVNKEKDKIIIMLIDGRGESVGATHNEAGELLLEFGAYDAMHLDGGGSTTLVLRPEGETGLSVENTVSEGTQRLVANAIGIKTSNEISALKGLNININGDLNTIITGVSYTLSATGYDENKNPVSLDTNKLEVYFKNEESGSINGSNFTVNSEGTHTIIAKYEDIVSEVDIKSISGITALKPRASKTSLSIGDKTYITASAINKDGFSKDLSSYDIDWNVLESNIGYIENGHFYATAEGIANITATYKGISSSITIAVGKTSTPLINFENTRQLYMMYYPQNSGISGGAGVTSSYSIQGQSSLLLSYKFPAGITTTQATYVCFDKEPITLNSNATEIAMWVKGDGSSNLLKMVLKGADGVSQNVSISETLSFNDWKYIRAEIPADLKKPITLDKIYIAALSTTSQSSGVIYIDDITQLISRNDGGVITNSYTDYLQVNLEQTSPSTSQEDITIFGQTAEKPATNSQTILADSISKMSNKARAMIFVGKSDISSTNSTNIPIVQWNNTYYTTNTSYVSIINLATSSGYMFKESENQWRWLQSYLKSFSKNNIIINMDKDIWSSAYSLSGTRENELLHKILKNFVLETGKNVIVVSATGNTTYSTVKDGIRYINLNGLSASDTTNLNNYKYLRVRADENNFNYEICNVYK